MTVVSGVRGLAISCGAVRAWTGPAAIEAAWQGLGARASQRHGEAAPWRRGPQFQPHWMGVWGSPLDRKLRCSVARAVRRRIFDWSLLLDQELYGEGLRARAEDGSKLQLSVSCGGARP
jgi:hypothetical protein